MTVTVSLQGRDFSSGQRLSDEGTTPLEDYTLLGSDDGFGPSTPPFNGVDEPFHFSGGETTITAEDGSSMTLTPLDAGTVNVTLGDATIPLERADGYDFTCYPDVRDGECSIPLYYR